MSQGDQEEESYMADMVNGGVAGYFFAPAFALKTQLQLLKDTFVSWRLIKFTKTACICSMGEILRSW